MLGFLTLVAARRAAPLQRWARPGLSRSESARPRTRSAMRHAFDADHISAIDNTTRKLMAEGKRPLTRGVLVLARPLHDRVRARFPAPRSGSGRSPARSRTMTPSLHQVTNWIGTLVSGFFLYVIAAINLLILVGSSGSSARCAAASTTSTRSKRNSNSRGFMNRFFGRLTGPVTKPPQMYPVGVLFGLGFDTATEVALLVLAGSAGALGFRGTRSCASRSCSPPECR